MAPATLIGSVRRVAVTEVGRNSLFAALPEYDNHTRAFAATGA
jgi:hypothetical protein